MFTDIEQLKREFLDYLNFLIFPSPEILVEKVQPLQGTKLRKIKFQSDLELPSTSEGKNSNVIFLNKNNLGIYGISVSDFKRNIETIKNNDKNSEKLLYQAIEEVINLNNIKLCKIVITDAILTYTKLYEKFRLANPNVDKDGIYDLIDKIIKNSLIDNPILLIYNYFTRAYQGYENTRGFASVFGDQTETEDLKIIFNITKELKLNFTPYQNSYTTLINLIETFYIYAEDKEAANSLIVQLKHHTNLSFSTLIQKSSGKQIEKTVIKDFKLTVEKLIKNYIEDHPVECKKQRSILDYLLWFITKIIPESVFPKDKRMALFGKYTETGKEIKNLTKRVIEKTANLVC